MPPTSPSPTPPGGDVIPPSISTTLTLNGTDYDVNGRRSPRLLLDELVVFERDGIPTLRFIQHTHDLGNPPYQFESATVSLHINGTLYFAGDVQSVLPRKDNDTRYSLFYDCEGLRARCERFPVTDDNTGTDTVSFNLQPDDPAYLPSRAGRTAGQVILSVLEMTTNSANLIAAGVGLYTAGSGAAASASTASGSVTGATVTAGGSGYTTAPTVVFSGGGYTTQATGHATVSGGVVTGVVVDSAGSGYRYSPAVILSRLPVATVNDLAAMSVIPMWPCIVQGEKLLGGIEAFMKNVHPNHCLHVMPDGTIRFLDTRKFGGTTVSFSGGGGVGALAVAQVNPVNGAVSSLILVEGGGGYTTAPSVTITGSPGSGASGSATVTNGTVTAISLGAGGTNYPQGRTAVFTLNCNALEPPSLHRDSTNCYSRVQIRGRPLVDPVELSLLKGDLVEHFDHDGLSNADAKTKWKPSDFNQPSAASGAAVATAVLASAGIDTTFTIVSGGSGYTSAPTITFSSGGGTGAAATATVSGGAVTAITRTAAGSGYTVPPTMSFSGGGGSGAAATCQLQGRAVSSLSLVDGGNSYSSAPTLTITGGGGSGATGHTTVSGGAVNAVVLDTGGSGYTSLPIVHIAGPVGSSVDYGTCTCPDTLHVTVTSDDPTRTWGANFWDQTEQGKHGLLLLRSSVDGSIAQLASRQVVANASLSPGGTSSLTVDRALDITTYDTYALRGLTLGGSVVWRRYSFANTAIGAKATNEPFTYPAAFHSADGNSATMTTNNSGAILYSSSGNQPWQQGPLSFVVDPTASPPTLTFASPVVWVYGTAQSPVVPSEIRVLVGVYKQNLTATSPADIAGVAQYGGTLSTVDGIHRTLFIQLNDWRDPIGQTAMNTYAAELLDSVKDVVIEGDIEYLGLFEPGLTPQLSVDIAGWNGASFTTGWESINIPVVRCALHWPKSGPLICTTSMHLSNRRAPYTSQPLLPPMRHPAPLGFTDGQAGFMMMGGPVHGISAGLDMGMAGQGLSQVLGPNFTPPGFSGPQTPAEALAATLGPNMGQIDVGSPQQGLASVLGPNMSGQGLGGALGWTSNLGSGATAPSMAGGAASSNGTAATPTERLRDIQNAQLATNPPAPGDADPQAVRDLMPGGGAPAPFAQTESSPMQTANEAGVFAPGSPAEQLKRATPKPTAAQRLSQKTFNQTFPGTTQQIVSAGEPDPQAVKDLLGGGEGGAP